MMNGFHLGVAKETENDKGKNLKILKSKKKVLNSQKINIS